MESNNSEPRNAQGFADLTDRYRRRARTLTTGPGVGSFIEAVREARHDWNKAYPEYLIVPAIADLLPPVPDSRQNAFYQIYWPGRILRDYEHFLQPQHHGKNRIRTSLAHQHWTSIVSDLCIQFWHPENFVRPYGMHQQPPARFVSAALLFDVRTMGKQVIDSLFEPLRLQLQSLPYPPDPFDGYERARVEGERDWYRDQLRQHVDDRALESLEHNAIMAGYDRANEVFPQGPVPDPDSCPYWWYLPLLPGVSSSDVIQVASEMAEHSKYIYGQRPVEDRIRNLAADGLSHARIATALGVSESRVSRTLKKTDPDPE